jgi:hypothetical protein
MITGTTVRPVDERNRLPPLFCEIGHHADCHDGNSIGGIPAISAVCVIFVGILGAVFGHTTC